MPVYQALKTGICQSPKGEKNISNQYVLYLSFCEDIPFYTNDRSIMYYHDVLNDICYEIGSELSYMGKASGITDKLSILNGFKQSRPDEYQQLIEEIKEAFVPTFFKKDVPDEMSFVFSESFVDWLKYNSVHDFAAVGQALQDADRTITISPKDILNDYIIPTLKGNLHTISTLAQSLGVYTFVDVQVEDGPLMNVLREELPKLNYYKYNSGWIQYELGYLTHYGQGCDRDIEAAIKYYTAAYKDGNVLACNLLGWIFQQGDGVTVDLIQAVEWYSRGSQMGNADAMNNLAYMYLNGLGVEVDENKAFEWYVKASEGGNLNSMIRLAEFYFKGGPTPVDYSKAYEWANKAISIGNAPRIANAKYIVGYILLNGLAGKVDIAEAFLRLEEAAKGGVVEAWELCGDIVLQHKDDLRLGLSDPTPSEYYGKGHKAGIDSCSLKLVREKIKQGDYNYFYFIDRLLDKNIAEAHYLVALYYRKVGYSNQCVKKYLELPVKEGHPEAIALLEQVNKEQAAHDEQIRQEQLKKEAEEAAQREATRLAQLAEEERLRKEQEAAKQEEERIKQEREQQRIENEKRKAEIQRFVSLYNNIQEGISWAVGSKGTRDYNRAAHLLIEGAKEGIPEAMAWLALIFSKSGSEAVFNLAQNSLNGFDSDFYLKLGKHYNPESLSDSQIESRANSRFKDRISESQKIDLIRGNRCYRLSRNRGVSGDCYGILAYFYLYGFGCRRNVSEAIKYAQKGHSMGSGFSDFILGSAYHQGIGVVKDIDEAQRFYINSSKYLSMGETYLARSAIVVMQNGDRLRAIELLQYAARNGSAVAMCEYGEYLIYQKDYANAERWLRKSVQQSDGDKNIINRANMFLVQLKTSKESYKPTEAKLYFDYFGKPTLEKPVDFNDDTDEPKKGFFSRIFGKK